MSFAIAGKKAVIQLGDPAPPAAPTSWEDIDEVYEIGELPLRAGIYDVTSHGSSLYREIKPGLYDIVEMSLAVNYLDISQSEQYDEMFTFFLNNTLNSYRLLWPDGSFHQFISYVTDITPTTPLDERITYNVTLTVDGDVSYTTPE